MVRKKPVGWRGEPHRHSLAARGIPTGRKVWAASQKRLIRGQGEPEKLARDIQERNFAHYRNAKLQEIVDALADVEEFGDPELLYEARTLFMRYTVGNFVGWNEDEFDEHEMWGLRLDSAIEEYEEWLRDEDLEREDVLPLVRGRPGTKFRRTKKGIRLPGPGPDVDELV